MALSRDARLFIRDFSSIIFALTLLLTYLFGGAAIFSGMEGWAYADSLYYMVVTGTTVGYGDITPTKWYSRLVCCAFILFGISLIAYALSIIASFLLSRQEKFMKNLHSQTSEQISKQFIDRSKVPVPLLQALGIILCTLATGILIYAFAEDSDFVTSLYWAVVTSSSVGYGDLPISESNRHWILVYILFAPALTAAAVGKFVEFALDQKNSDYAKTVLGQKLTMRNIETMDKDGDGRVDPKEFLEAMLVNLKLVEQEDINRINQRFKDLDVDGSGFLDQADLLALVDTRDPLGPGK